MIIVYTVITNDYDDLGPVMSTDNVKYVCYTDDVSIYANGWELREATQHNRYYKFHSHYLFPEADYTIYVDGHAELTKQPELIVTEMGTSSIAQQKHPVRDCLYEEADVCVQLGLEDKDRAKDVMTMYKEVKFPEHYGLMANGCIVRKNDKTSKTFDNVSWVFLKGLKRDQLVTQFVSWYFELPILEMTMFKWGGHKNV